MAMEGRYRSILGAAVQATEEAITNTLVAAETMTGADGFRVFGLPHSRLETMVQKYNRGASAR